MMLAGALLASASPYAARFVCDVADEWQQRFNVTITIPDWQPLTDVTLERRFEGHKVTTRLTLMEPSFDDAGVATIWMTNLVDQITLTHGGALKFDYREVVRPPHPPEQKLTGNCKANIRKPIPKQNHSMGIER
jgi:hypothetical protein